MRMINIFVDVTGLRMKIHPHCRPVSTTSIPILIVTQDQILQNKFDPKGFQNYVLRSQFEIKT